MSIINFILGRKKLPYYKELRFRRTDSDIKLEIGQELKLWNKPNTNEIYLYVKGSVGGDGLVGIAKNSIIRHHLKHKKEILINNSITKITSGQIKLSVNITDNKKNAIQYERNLQERWIEKVNKNYNPKVEWELRFYSTTIIKKADLIIEAIPITEVHSYFENKDQTVWLTDKNNNLLNAENRLRDGSTEKTLRAIYSGHEIVVKDIKKEDAWYYITVGIKK